MHLAFLTPEFPHSRTRPSAGIGTSVQNMSRGLADRGVVVSIFVYGQQENVVLEENGIRLHLIKHRYYKFFNWYLNRKSIQNYLNKYIYQDKIDALEAADWTGITAFMKFLCPLVIRLNGSDTYFCHLEKRPQKKKNFWMEKKALKNADYLLSVSRFTAIKTKELFNLKQKIQVIPNSVNIKSFSPHPGKEVPDTLLYFGSLIRKKGVLELVKIFNLLVAKYPKVQLKLAGSDKLDIQTGKSTKELLLSLASEEARRRIVFLEVLPYHLIREEIAQASVVVLPSFAEALPMTWIEAMAMGKAMVTSNIGWAKEIMIDGKTGYVENPEDHSAYVEKVLKLLNDPELAQRMGKAAREQVINKFSTAVVIRENIRFYEEVIQKKA